MNYPTSTIFLLITLAFLASLSLPWPATSASSPSSVHNFLHCLANKSAPLLESIYTPTNPSFNLVLRSLIRNRRFLTPQTPKPAAIVAPTSVSQVQATVVCARDNGVQIRIRSGGHDYEGLSYRSNVTFIILDMFNLRSIKVDVGKEVAYVQAGATLGELYYRIANASNVHAFPSGVCTGLGIGGHFSGGGYGTLMRKYGLSVDNIFDAQVVDVNGNILTRATMGEDLFWAIGGGGGASFAVIVSWKIKLVRIPEKLTVFDLPFSLEKGVTYVAFKWQQVAPKLHEDLFIRLQPMVVNGTILVHVVGFFLGESERLVPLLNQSFPELNLQKADCNETSWIETFLPPGTPPEALLNRTRGAKDFSKKKSDYVKSVISKEGIETIWKLLIELANTTSATVIMQWNPYGRKMGEIPASNTPFPHRSGYLFLVQYIVFWDEGDINLTNHNIERVRYLYERMAPFVSKHPREAFLNYRDIDIGSTASDKANFKDAVVYGSKYFRDNFPRLTRVKAEVDPHNFFKNEQTSLSLPWPATSASSPSSVHNFLHCLANKSAPLLESIYTPTNPSFNLVLRSLIRNRRFLTPQTPKPTAIVAPTSVSQVQATVVCARDNGEQIRIRSGGHDYEGLSYRSNVTFIILDMFNLRSIKVDVGKEVAYVQAGAMLGELYYRIANASNVHAFPSGVCTGLGTGGHFSDGGYGTLMRKYGPCCHCFMEDQAGSDSRESDCIRLAFQFRKGGHRCRFQLDRNVSTPGTPPEALLNRTRGAQDFSKNKSDYVKSVISKEGIETIWKLLIELANTTSATVIMQWNPYGGKMGEIPTSSTPFPHRSGYLFLVQYIVFWDEGDINVTNHNIERVRYLYERMAQFVSKHPREAFLNYRDIDIGSTASDKTNFKDAVVYGSKYFRDNFPRLTRVKAEVDPHNFFKNEQTFLASLSLPWPATSASSPSSVHNFLHCLANKSAPLLESIYTPTNPSFNLVLRSLIRNRRFLTPQTPKPAAIVAPTSVSQVQATVVCARDNGVQIRIRSGGHDYEGLSYRSNVTFIILDMFNLRSIKVDVGKEVAFVQAGATPGELYYRIANASNVHAFPSGVCTGLGTGGHFSGDGYGTLMRKYGLSVDNIFDAQVVDVNGNILTRATMGEDLFWAIRGGGGASFAVIVSWKIKLVRIPEKVIVFDLPFSLEKGATDVAFKWQQVAPKLHEDLFIRLQPMVVNGTILVHVVGFFLGETERLVPLLNQSFPELNLQKADCHETSWIETFLPPGTPPEALLNRTRGAQDFSKNKSDYVKSVISKEGIETIWKLLIELANTTSATVIMQWNPYGGKMGEIPASSTPFPHRSGYLFLVQYIVFWDEGDINATNHNIERVRYLTASDKTNFKDAVVYGSKYFRDNFPRLTRVKVEVDPHNFFKNEQSIPPKFN
ncbi:hypothetical protein GQ457_13G017600 [Hibiscus cannabinus]